MKPGSSETENKITVGIVAANRNNLSFLFICHISFTQTNSEDIYSNDTVVMFIKDGKVLKLTLIHLFQDQLLE